MKNHKTAKYDLDIYYKEFSEHINNNKQYQYYEGLRDKIKNDYIEKIKDQKININVEKLMLNLLISNMESTTRSEVMNIIMISISILASGIINAIINFTNFWGTVIFSSICTFVIMFSYLQAFKREPHKLFLYKLCLKILEEIENEVKVNNF
ncbi:hypothetical protein CLG_B2215 [Clostridium phage D-1873]|uniref:Uncharacterized protein n=1 Tax=Clostridium botulinum D str. 1873 TaxID=592027 RepID=A0A9P2LKF1_CLOBO|nr:hypothetical protein [Clostridium botulinum]EES90400.1 hypothetical protein CLG_B2215 [Clostridium phage D-1873]MCD3245318.1 hypothetical protein [Clostridium botulinum C]MCD3261697.1 hypothetical protein [Clostridium botulinum C]QPW56439.1 hypothetical protein IRP61_11205 [Clostridium botulinum]